MVNLLSLPMRNSIDTPQLRRVKIRNRSFSRLTAFGATWIVTCEPVSENPNPSSVACAACRIEDFLPVHLQLQPPFDHAADALGHPLGGSLSTHEDPQVVRIPHEPVTAAP